MLRMKTNGPQVRKLWAFRLDLPHWTFTSWLASFKDAETSFSSFQRSHQTRAFRLWSREREADFDRMGVDERQAPQHYKSHSVPFHYNLPPRARCHVFHTLHSTVMWTLIDVSNLENFSLFTVQTASAILLGLPERNQSHFPPTEELMLHGVSQN
jgi:hypothetical protein